MLRCVLITILIFHDAIWNMASKKKDQSLGVSLACAVRYSFQLNVRQLAMLAPYQCLVCRSGEPAVVMNPLVHGRGMVTNPLNDIIHIDDVCGLYIERPREGNIHLTKNIQPEILEVSH